MSNTEHIDELQADPTHLKGNATSGGGCVTKCVGSEFKKHHGSYRRNGYDEHKSNPVKSVRYGTTADRVEQYGRPVREQLIGAKKGKRRTPVLPSGPSPVWLFTGKNFKNSNLPFAHQYHHIVPWDVLSNSFLRDELKLLQSQEYNLNEGINTIILPCFDRIAILIGMYTHPNDHPRYSRDLIAMLKAFKVTLKGSKSKHLKKKEIAGFKTELRSWEVAEWQVIADGGREAMGAHVNEHPLSKFPRKGRGRRASR